MIPAMDRKRTMTKCAFTLRLLILLFALVVIMADTRYPEMKGVHLRVTASQWPPVIQYSKNADGTITYKGIVVNILDYISTALDITYSFVFLNETEVNQVGVVQASMNAIIRHEVDMTSTGFVVTYERFKAMDLSIPVLVQDYRFALSYPTEESRLLAPIHPFELMVWVSVLGTLVVMVLVLSFLSGFYRKYFRTTTDKDQREIKYSLIDFRALSDYTLYMLKIITYKGQWMKISHFSFRLAVGVWVLMALVLVNVYSGNLFSYLAVPKLNPIPNTFDELADKYPQQKITLEANSVMADMFMMAKNGKFKVLGDSLRENPESMFKTRAGLSKLMSTLNFAYAGVDLLTNPVIAEGYNKETGKCRFTYSKPIYPFKQFQPIVFGLQKNGPYTKAINSQFQVLLDTGLLNQWVKSSMFRVDPCLLRNYNAGAQQKALSLVDVSCAFLIFGMGIGLAVLVLPVEYVSSHINRKWNTKKIWFVRNRKVITIKPIAATEPNQQLEKEK